MITQAEYDALEASFEGHDLDTEIQIDDATVVLSVANAVETHLRIIRADLENPSSLPYYNRLMRISNKLNKAI